MDGTLLLNLCCIAGATQIDLRAKCFSVLNEEQINVEKLDVTLSFNDLDEPLPLPQVDVDTLSGVTHKNADKSNNSSYELPTPSMEVCGLAIFMSVTVCFFVFSVGIHFSALFNRSGSEALPFHVDARCFSCYMFTFLLLPRYVPCRSSPAAGCGGPALLHYAQPAVITMAVGTPFCWRSHSLSHVCCKTLTGEVWV